VASSPLGLSSNSKERVQNPYLSRAEDLIGYGIRTEHSTRFRRRAGETDSGFDSIAISSSMTCIGIVTSHTDRPANNPKPIFSINPRKAKSQYHSRIAEVGLAASLPDLHNTCIYSARSKSNKSFTPQRPTANEKTENPAQTTPKE
jgi:hypothetical protein